MKPSLRNFFEYTAYNTQHCHLLNFVELTSVNKSTKHLKLLPPGNTCVEHSIKNEYSYLFTSLMYLFYSIVLSFQSNTVLKLYNLSTVLLLIDI